MPATVGAAAAFGAYLVVAAALSALSPGHAVGVVVLAVVAAALGWWTTVPGALLVGLLGWPFYSGFVTHAAGVLAVHGLGDGVVASVLVAGAVGASGLRGLIELVRAPRVVDVPSVGIPAQRRPVEQLQHR